MPPFDLIVLVVVIFLVAVIEYTNTRNLRKEEFILAYHLRIQSIMVGQTG